MPYRLNPRNKRCVQVKKRGRWRSLKCHRTSGAARAHLSAVSLAYHRRVSRKRRNRRS